jgi:hypothetical protein
MIVSTTLVGAGCDAVIGNAIKSVAPYVDACIIIATCGHRTVDRAIDIACNVCECEGTRAVTNYSMLIGGDAFRFDSARNFALQCARLEDAEWALTVDTDERLNFEHLPNVLTCCYLEACLDRRVGDEDVVLCSPTDKSYLKERFIRTNTRGWWRGATHESFFDFRGRTDAPWCTFDEVPKTPAQLETKYARDEKLLERYVQEEGKGDGRWWYYLGETRKNRCKHEQAIHAYLCCATLPGWDEQRAWAMFRASECAVKLNRYEEALGLCARGMAFHAGIAELPWHAGWCAWKLGNPRNAIYWSKLALQWSARNELAWVERVGFRHVPALYEGPHDVLRWAYRALGDEVRANQHEHAFNEELARRLKCSSRCDE